MTNKSFCMVSIQQIFEQCWLFFFFLDLKAQTSLAVCREAARENAVRHLPGYQFETFLRRRVFKTYRRQKKNLCRVGKGSLGHATPLHRCILPRNDHLKRHRQSSPAASNRPWGVSLLWSDRVSRRAEVFSGQHPGNL